MKVVHTAIVYFALAGAVVACSTSKESTAGSTAESLTSVNVYHSTQNGGGAKGSVNRYDSQSFYNLSFDAWENKTGTTRSASLSFSGYGASLEQVCYDEPICIWDPNTWSCTWETYQYCYYDYTKSYYIYGFGEIPTGDFRVGGHTAHLTTDLSQDPSFTAIKCGWDSSWNYTCAPLTGTIDVVWRDNGNYSTDQQGTFAMTAGSPWGQYTTRSVGHQSETSADVSGTFLGDTVGSWGAIDQSKDTVIAKDVFKGPPPPPPGSTDGGAPPPPPPPDAGTADGF